MARPKTDVDAARKRLLEATERLLKAHGPRKITVSEVAAACGMSQSNAYRFFPSKQALLEAVGERWFEHIEAELAGIAGSEMPPQEQFVAFVARQFELKRARYAADPELFKAYLELGLANMGVVTRHLERLGAFLTMIMKRCAERGLLGAREPETAVALAEAMTVRFRDPGQIMRYFEADSPERAREVAHVILAGFAGSERSKPPANPDPTGRSRSIAAPR